MFPVAKQAPRTNFCLSFLRVISKHQNARTTYAELDVKSNALARGLESRGVQKGDRVGVMLGNSMEYSVVGYYCFPFTAMGLTDIGHS